MERPASIRNVLGLAVLLISLAFAAPALAQAQDQYEGLGLDELFVELKDAPNPGVAQQITNHIWMIWLEPEDPEAGALMDIAMQARRESNLDRAVTTLNVVVDKYPDYAEGWNQRATIYYLMGRYQDSLDDIDEVLKREPRHFGALAGQALIYVALGDRRLALQSVLEALQYHPFLVERQLFPELLEPATKT